MARFPFNDLHSFKDYVVFVQMCSPNEFPFRDGVSVEDQWTLDLAFGGLKEGLSLAEIEKGQCVEFDKCKQLISEAYTHYGSGNRKEGYLTLERVVQALKRIRTR